MNSRNVLIVGGGFIGKNLAGVVAAKGFHPLLVTRSGPWNGPPAEVVIADATKAEVFDALLPRVSHVMFAHSGLKPAESQEQPLIDVHALLEPIEAAFSRLSDHPGVGVTHFSSGGTVYGEVDQIPTPETAPLSPMSFYGVNRWAAEQYLSLYASVSNPVTILRCSNLYGHHQPAGGTQGLVGVVADRLRRGAPITIYGDGRTERDYILATDVCHAAVTLAFDVPVEEPLSIYNCGSGVGTETIDLVHRIAECLDIGPKLEYVPDRGFDVRRSVLDVSKLAAAIDFRPADLATGLRYTLDPEIPTGQTAETSTSVR